jgi:periplasmic divalent cation tolerance protein
MKMKDSYVVVFSTAPNAEDASSIATAVVDEGLAACCNIVPGLRSIYKWKGELCDEPEVLCIFKTRAGLFEKLRDRIKELHSYEVPEVVSIAIDNGLPEYLDWITGDTVKGD